jgi:hypothetical protein
MQLMGTRLVGGTSPGKGGSTHLGVPIFDTVAEAVRETGAVASGIFVPPAFAADAIMEAAVGGITLIACVTEGIPIQDMIRVKDFLRGYPETRLIGPNCPGLLTPGQAKIGIIPQRFSSPGPVGIVSRSGTLTYETMAALTAAGMGQSTIVGIGGDPVLGLTFSDVIQLFEQDPGTTHLAVIAGPGLAAPGGRLHLGPNGARGQAHGPRRRHRLRQPGHGQEQGGGVPGRRRARRRDHPGHRPPAYKGLTASLERIRRRVRRLRHGHAGRRGGLPDHRPAGGPGGSRPGCRGVVRRLASGPGAGPLPDGGASSALT